MKLTTDECSNCGRVMYVAIDKITGQPILACDGDSCGFYVEMTLGMAREIGRIEVDADGPVDAMNCAILREYYKARAKQYDDACREWVADNDGITVDGETLDAQKSKKSSYDSEVVVNLLLDAGADHEDVSRLVKIKSQKDLEYLVRKKMADPVIHTADDGTVETLWMAIKAQKITADSERFGWKKGDNE